MKTSAVLIFISGSRGVREFSTNCSVAPATKQEVEIQREDPRYKYHWDDIPLSNQIYFEVFRAVFGRRLVVLDVLDLFQRMKGCRSDGLHFRVDVPATPKNIIWQMIYNVLVEMKEGQVLV